MPLRKPIIASSDFHELNNLLQDEMTIALANSRELSVIRQRLDTALIVDDVQVPAGTVTMDSLIALADVDSNQAVYRLVYPDQADIRSNLLSVLTPIGVAILGQHVGQDVTLLLPKGRRKISIGEVLFQTKSELKFRNASTKKMAGNRHRLTTAAAKS